VKCNARSERGGHGESLPVDPLPKLPWLITPRITRSAAQMPREARSLPGDPAKPAAPVHGGKLLVDMFPCFCKHRNMATARARKASEKVAKYADMFSAMGTEARLRIMQLLLSAHPDGMVVGEIQEELDIPNSTLSHHLDKLRMEDLVNVKRESTFLRYTANTDALQEVLQFLYAECCTRNKAVKPEIVQICR
jgi:ArsR family transcriptional regulator, arsenate/arsenite/antimonite-responsive transcriptional repressor